MSAAVIDCHGHYTTSPRELATFRKAQIDALADPRASRGKSPLYITDDQIRESVEGSQIRVQRERGTDVTLFSPRAAGMGHREPVVLLIGRTVLAQRRFGLAYPQFRRREGFRVHNPMRSEQRGERQKFFESHCILSLEETAAGRLHAPAASGITESVRRSKETPQSTGPPPGSPGSICRRFLPSGPSARYGNCVR